MPSAESLEQTKKNVRDAVVLFEHKEGSKQVETKDIGSLIRSLGVNPSGAQVTIIIDQLSALAIEGQNSNLCSMEHIEIVVANFLVKEKKALFRDDYHTLIRAFKALDPEGKGYVDASHLRQVLCTKGEPMTEEELNLMLCLDVMGGKAPNNRSLPFFLDSSGRLFYEDYAQQLANDGRRL